MIRTIIVTEMILHRCTCMVYSDVIKFFPVGLFVSPEQQLQVHHIIYNNRTLPFIFIVIPRTDTTHIRLIPGNQRFCRFDKYSFVIRVMRQTISVTKTTEHFKPHIVRTAIGLFTFNRCGKLFCFLSPILIAGIFIHIPQFSREKSAAPISRSYEMQ